MSIFKQTFKPHLQKQIKARQKLLSYKEGANGARPIDLQMYTSAKSPWVKMTSLVDYKGDQTLARNYILFGGTLYPDPASPKDALKNKLRSGVSVKGGSYGTNLGSGQYGIRPMPGISHVDIKSKGAYGSLREATITYYAWDVKQLENLFILFMKPGYHVILEWGWSMYLNSDTGKVIDGDFKTLDCFDPTITIEGIYSNLAKYNERYQGNYEGMLGTIKNFSYTMLPNGGFECTTVLISIGDVIESIKMNAEKGVIIKKQEVGTTNDLVRDLQDKKDEFELLMGALANGGVSSTNTSDALIQQIDKKIPIGSLSIIDKDIKYFGTFNSTVNPTLDYTANLSSKTYIQFAYFIHILNEFTNIFLDKGQKLVEFEIPHPKITNNLGNGLCIASYNSMTIDNSVCVIQNSSANLLGANGYSPEVISLTNAYPTQNKMDEYLYKNTNFGIIGNIYINIGKILDIYKIEHKASNGGVSVAKFLRALLQDISYTLGSINSFDLSVNDNRCAIIDKHYVELEEDSEYGSKFNLSIGGIDTTVRRHNLTSRIFQEQATMIAIAAQSRENIASLQSSTNVFMNKNIEDRLYRISGESRESLDNLEAQEKKIFLGNIRVLLTYVKQYVMTGKSFTNSEVSVGALNTFLNTLLVRIDKGTNYKAIIPLFLEIEMDGLGGVTIGEIFTIDKDMLPAEYNNKAVGFIVTGISQAISRPDWTTTLVTQFCLLDQLERQKETRKSVRSFTKELDEEVSNEKSSVYNSVINYNILIAFLHDFFKDQFDIKSYEQDTAELLYSSRGGRLRAMKAMFDQFKGDIGVAFSYMKKEMIGRATYTGTQQKAFGRNTKKSMKDPTQLSTYLDITTFSSPATQIPSEQTGVIQAPSVVGDIKGNVIKYLDYIISNNPYYRDMDHPEIKRYFDNAFSGIKAKYMEGSTVVQDIVGALLSGNTSNILSSIVPSVIDGGYQVPYYNPEAYNEYGILDPAKLNSGVSLSFTFDKAFKK
jgi:hypothetical protein